MLATRRMRVAILLVLGLAGNAVAQFGMGGMGGQKDPPKAAAVKSDIPFIKCQVRHAWLDAALASWKVLPGNSWGQVIRWTCHPFSLSFLIQTTCMSLCSLPALSHQDLLDNVQGVFHVGTRAGCAPLFGLVRGEALQWAHHV